MPLIGPTKFDQMRRNHKELAAIAELRRAGIDFQIMQGRHRKIMAADVRRALRT